MTALVRTQGVGDDAHGRDEGRRKLPDVLGIAWTLIAALVVLSPALRPGVALGSFDLLSRVGLTQRSGVAVHSLFPADQVLYFLPMINLAWHQVHSGQVPLWNPYNLLGLPLAFNWQSGVFSLPTLISYLVPLHYVYTVIVLVKLVVAGTGVYTLCRVLGQRPLSCAFAATTFELSGPMLHWYGWAMTGVTIWAAWILVAAILLIRGAHRLRDTIFLAASIALSVYGGHPESLIVMTLAFLIFFVVYLLMRAHTAGSSLRRPVFDLVVAGACGLALSAPLLLPGLQTAAMSGRGAALGASAYPLADIPDVFADLQGNDFRVPPPYIGALTIVLALVAVRLYWRRPVVTALAAVTVTTALLSFQTPLYGVLEAAPGIRTITWNRAVMLLALATSVLAGFGLDALGSSTSPPKCCGAGLGGVRGGRGGSRHRGRRGGLGHPPRGQRTDRALRVAGGDRGRRTGGDRSRGRTRSVHRAAVGATVRGSSCSGSALGRAIGLSRRHGRVVLVPERRILHGDAHGGDVAAHRRKRGGRHRLVPAHAVHLPLFGRAGHSPRCQHRLRRA